MAELLWKNVKLYDGTGKEPFMADVGVKDDRIAAVAPAGTLPSATASVIDGRGRDLVPGFIDVHGHSDTLALETPSGDSKIAQAVTTEIVGNCGFADYLEAEPESATGGVSEFRYDGNFDSYCTTVESVRPALNIAALCGHNSLRRRVMGYADRKPTTEEMNRMKAYLAEALAHGAVGFSSGLWYLPGKFAGTEELCELASLLKGTGKIYTTHLRSEDDALLESIDEAVRIARAGDNRLELSHFKAFYPRNWRKIDTALQKVAEYQAQGTAITADRYPYTYSSTSLRMAVPPPYDKLNSAALSELLRNSAQERQLFAKAVEENDINRVAWERIIVVNSPVPEHRKFYGKTMAEIGTMLELAPAEALAELLSAGSPGAAFGTMCDENLNKILAQSYVMPGSDGCVRAFSDSGTHPRAFGTMPRFFRTAVKHNTPQEVIRRMSGFAADTFGLKGRGRVIPGYFADLVLMDLEKFDSSADFTHPNRAAEGVYGVWVNGVLAYEPGNKNVPGRSGKMLKVF